MKFLALPMILLTASPASAITWGEFWDPFTDRHHHVETHHYHSPPPRRKCFDNVYTESWDNYGRKSYYYRRVRVPCGRRYYDY
ncbi:cAMP phosphodiesterase [Synechococcus phage S-MbCM6]|uniref:cAMP phosphodiesterase n=1 Tax=Synechococcus phage S-MbCM6 TaxID=3126011 RepID=A0A0E3F9E4_9CAUD|nr:cAMP phosphodiesterase [Synechococcus phage ACG-2014c]